MLLTKFNPFQELRDLNKRFFTLSSAFPTFENELETSFSSFIPVMNTREGDYAYHIDIDLPGVKKEDIKVDVENNVLKISGERNFKKEVKEEDYYKMETSFGKFQRNFTLPNNVDSENIDASCSDGVLEITIPKIENREKEVKKIEVK
jgi:HSP20 family protein